MPQGAIIALVIIIISAVVVFKNVPFNQEQPTADKGFQASMNYSSPSPSSTPSLTSKPAVKATPKVSASPSPSPSASPSPTSTTSPSPTPKPSPQPGVYSLQPSPEQNIKLKASPTMGYSMSALLKDSNGDIVVDQSKVKYEWSVDRSDLFSMDPGAWGTPSDCGHGVKANPCPDLYNVVNTQGPKGNATIKVKAFMDGKNVGETSFNVSVE